MKIIKIKIILTTTGVAVKIRVRQFALNYALIKSILIATGKLLIKAANILAGSYLLKLLYDVPYFNKVLKPLIEIVSILLGL